MNPKVSIVIPTYNYGQFLIECLNSVIECSMKDYEIMIVDDGSNLKTKEILRNADEIYIDQSKKHGLHNKILQAFTVLFTP